MQRTKKIIFFILLFASPIIFTDDNPQYKFIDIHSHIFKSDQNFEVINSFLKENNVEYICLSGFYSNSTKLDPNLDLKIIEAAKNNSHFIPFLRGFELTDMQSLNYVRQMLEKNIFKGIGELLVNGHGIRLGADSPFMMELYKLAAQYQIPVLIHFTFGSMSKNEPGGEMQLNQLKNALAQHPATTIIVAHCGAGPKPQHNNYQQYLETLLANYPNLYLDLAGMHIDLYEKDVLTPLGETIIHIIKKYPDRFLLGFDFDDIMFPYEKGTEILKYYKKFLANFDLATAQQVAYTNAKQLLRL